MTGVRRTLDASPRKVWDVLADGWLYPLWVVGASRMREVDASWPAPGACLHHSVGSWPVLLDDSTAVLESRPEQLLRLRERYAGLIESKRHGTTHTHVYGANLAVRLDAYRRVGGFRAVVGEDQDLIDRLLADGSSVLGVFSPLVRTSARTPGRDGAGLGALLQRWGEDEPTVGEVANRAP